MITCPPAPLSSVLLATNPPTPKYELPMTPIPSSLPQEEGLPPYPFDHSPPVKQLKKNLQCLHRPHIFHLLSRDAPRTPAYPVLPSFCYTDWAIVGTAADLPITHCPSPFPLWLQCAPLLSHSSSQPRQF